MALQRVPAAVIGHRHETRRVVAADQVGARRIAAAAVVDARPVRVGGRATMGRHSVYFFSRATNALFSVIEETREPQTERMLINN
jgi:hypothetical protein